MRAVIYLFLTLFFIFLLLRLVDVGQVIGDISHARWSYILLSSVLSIITSFIIAYRLRILLGIIKKLPLIFVWGMGNISGLISMLLPLSAGGFITTYILSKKLKSSYTKTLSIFFIDYFLSFIPSIILFPIALFFFLDKKLLSVEYNTPAVILPLIVLLLILLVIIFMMRYKFFNFFHQRVATFLGLLKTNVKVIINALLLTVVFSFIGTVQSYLYFIAFGMHPHILDFILASSILVAINLIPGAPMKIGQYETFGLLTLSYLLGVDTNKVFAMLISQRAVSIIIVSSQGIISLYLLDFKLGKLLSVVRLHSEKSSHL